MLRRRSLLRNWAAPMMTFLSFLHKMEALLLVEGQVPSNTACYCKTIYRIHKQMIHSKDIHMQLRFFNKYSFLVLANKPCCSSHRWWRWVGHWPSSSDTRLWQPWQAGCRDNTTEASHDNTSTSIKDIDFNQMVMPLIKYQLPTYNLQLQDYR